MFLWITGEKCTVLDMGSVMPRNGCIHYLHDGQCQEAASRAHEKLLKPGKSCCSLDVRGDILKKQVLIYKDGIEEIYGCVEDIPSINLGPEWKMEVPAITLDDSPVKVHAKKIKQKGRLTERLRKARQLRDRPGTEAEASNAARAVCRLEAMM